MSAETDIKLEIASCKVAYNRDINILRDVSCKARAKSITGVIGPNGAGKSTLLKAIAGFARVSDGEIRVDGHTLTGTPAERLRDFGIAFVPQAHSLFPEMTVRENLRMGGWIRRHDKDWLHARLDACYDLFPGLMSQSGKKAGDLSGGQQRLLEIARSLVSEPSILLLDEPTVGLSPGLSDEVYEQVINLPERSGVTIILVDQNIRDCLRISDHVYVLMMGQNDTDGPAQDIQERLPEIVRGWMQRKGSGADISEARS